jgi:tetratricopeptide (TPR) repeat protein
MHTNVNYTIPIAVGSTVGFLLLVFVAVSLYGNFPFVFGDEPDNLDQVESDQLGGSKNHTIPLDSMGIKYEEGKEYLISGDYDEALARFIEVKTKKKGTELGKRATIYHGITLIELGRDKHNKNNEFQHAEQVLHELMTIYNVQPSTDNPEYTTFILSLARVSRELKDSNLDVRAHLEKLLLFTKDETKDRLYAELGFIEYYNCNFREALRFFQKGNGGLNVLGRIETYLATKEFDKAILLCDEFGKNQKRDKVYDQICRVCTYAHKREVYYDDRVVGDCTGIFSCNREGCTYCDDEKTVHGTVAEACHSHTAPPPQPKPDPEPPRETPKPCCENPSTTQAVPHQHTPVYPESQGEYVVVTGAFKVPEHAGEHLKQMTDLGIPSKIIYHNGQQLYKVRTSSCVSEQEAIRISNRLKTLGIEAYKMACTALEPDYNTLPAQPVPPVERIPSPRPQTAPIPDNRMPLPSNIIPVPLRTYPIPDHR